MKQNALLLLLALAGLTGCLEGRLAEKEAVVETDGTGVVAQAEFAAGSREDERLVVIRSNRSWFAHLNDLDNPVDPADPEASVPWGTLSTDHHVNLTNTTEETPVTIRFQRNYSQARINGILNIYSEGKIAASIPVVQEGAVYHLGADAVKSVAQCDADELVIRVDCNTAWTAQVASGSTAQVTLDTETGFDPGEVRVRFAENFSLSDKSADIVFSAQDCPDVTVHLTQNKAVPYLYVVEDADPRILGGATEASVRIRTNTDWTAEVLSSELDGFSIENASGASGISAPQTVNVRFEANPATDPHDIRKATVRFNAAGLDAPVDFTFTQRGVLAVSFLDRTRFEPEIASSWGTTNLCRPDRSKEDIDDFVYTSGAYSYTIRLSQYMQHVTTNYLYVLGSGIRPTITLPGIEGMELQKLRLECRIMSGTIQGFAGEVLSDDYPAEGYVALTQYVNKITWNGANTKDLYNLDFDLGETGHLPATGRGCILRMSHANQLGHDDYCKFYVRTIILQYL